MKPYFLLIVGFLSFCQFSFSQDSTKIHFLGTIWKKGYISFSQSLSSDRYYRNDYSYNNLISDSRHSSSFYNFNQNDFNQVNYSYRPEHISNLSFSLHPYSKKTNSSILIMNLEWDWFITKGWII